VPASKMTPGLEEAKSDLASKKDKLAGVVFYI